MADNIKPFFEIPSLLRMKIIDRMDTADRCRFSRCSKSSESEAKKSKNYIYSLQIANSDPLYVFVKHEADKKDSSQYDYCLEFLDFGGKVHCVTYGNETKWVSRMDRSTDVLEYGLRYFQKMLKQYQNTIKVLRVCCYLDNVNFEIDSLASLEELEIQYDNDIWPFLSKLQKPLKILTIQKDEVSDAVATYPQIYEVAHEICAFNLKLNYSQFQQLTATCIEIHIGYMTEENVSDLIKSWQRGAVFKRNFFYAWNLENSNFDPEILCQLLDSSDHDLYEEDLILKNYQNDKSARLTFCIFCGIPRLTFDEV